MCGSPRNLAASSAALCAPGALANSLTSSSSARKDTFSNCLYIGAARVVCSTVNASKVGASLCPCTPRDSSAAAIMRGAAPALSRWRINCETASFVLPGKVVIVSNRPRVLAPPTSAMTAGSPNAGNVVLAAITGLPTNPLASRSLANAWAISNCAAVVARAGLNRCAIFPTTAPAPRIIGTDPPPIAALKAPPFNASSPTPLRVSAVDAPAPPTVPKSAPVPAAVIP